MCLQTVVIFILSIACIVGAYFPRKTRFRALASYTTLSTTAKSWDESIYNQEILMGSDMCILVDDNDKIVGYESKLNCHQVQNLSQFPKLHRAFSIFFFDDEGKLLLQRRSTKKLTFPGVWTNTCCSHQLLTSDKSEIDVESEVCKGNIPGTLRAAKRKLRHELGMNSDIFEDRDFRFLTRIKYEAIDKSSRHVVDNIDHYYGEAEVDYIVFLRKSSTEPLEINPHPEEIEQVRYATKDEMRTMLNSDSGYQWSPWFRLIAENLLFNWWDNLDKMCPKDFSATDCTEEFSTKSSVLKLS